MKYLETLALVRATSSTNEKIRILAEGDSPELRTILDYAYNPAHVYGVKAFTFEEQGIVAGNQLDRIFSLLEVILEGKVTGNKLKAMIGAVGAHLDSDHKDLLKKIILQDLRIDAGIRLINAALNFKFIEKFEVMACGTLDEKTEKHVKYPAWAQVKYDAARCVAIYNRGDLNFMTRSGKVYQIPAHSSLYQDVLVAFETYSRISMHDTGVLDGELWVAKHGMEEPEIRQISNGIANQVIKGTAEWKDIERLRYTVWDVIPTQSFFAGHDQTPYHRRWQDVRVMVTGICGRIKLAENTVVQSADEAYALAKDYISKGLEGIILKDLDGDWQAKRVKHCLKVKAKIQSEMRIVSFEEGDGKYVGSMGRINVMSEDGKITCGVGSGFSDADRRYFWDNQESLIGTIITLEHNGISKNSKGFSLYLPIYIERRFDKDHADTFEKIQDGT